MAFRRVSVNGTPFDTCTEDQVVQTVRAALDRGAGGRILTPNVDILRQTRADPAVREYLLDATLVVADGMPVVWASRLARTPLPERVAGSSLVWSLAAGLARDARSVYLLGGAPGGGGARAAARLADACPGLRIAGSESPGYGFERDPRAFDAACAALIETKPDLVYVGLGFPKQERVISRLRSELPFTWFLGCGMAINFIAGDRARAPGWMQRSGLEWAHRLATEPRRLAGRYLRHDAPYAVRLLASSCVARYRSRPSAG